MVKNAFQFLAWFNIRFPASIADNFGSRLVYLQQVANKTASQAYEWSMTTPMPTFDVGSLVTAYEASFPQPDPYTATGLSNTVHLVDPAQSRAEQYVRAYCRQKPTLIMLFASRPYFGPLCSS